MDSKSETIELFDQMLAVDGILGAIVLNLYGEYLCSRGSGKFQEMELRKIGAMMSTMIESVNDRGVFPDDIVYNYQNHCLMLKYLETGFLLLINKPISNASTLFISINFALTRLPFLISNLEVPEPSDNEKENQAQAIAAIQKVKTTPQDGLSQGTVILNRGANVKGNTVIRMKPDIVRPAKMPISVESDSESKNPGENDNEPFEDDGFIQF